ncbi:ORF955 [White spot syndrome virus]|uniref:Wsv365 n=3 Tax=White spot syndrome virus TaxID=342409 RepID=Q8VAN6_WSSVS|nr:wsv365 [Shrimp white spot syndrome virus]AFX59742.1 wsv365 [White spot syndrome virus]AAL33367.1 wsv365 [Shrimp white spot syndrome virus]AAL89292.1 WSSV424 [Shrimp white spot syndrome virus]ATU83979.1 ORF955 [White spot syndrome virus]AWQ60491.1 wsv365 [Shrimp white spot syndrome virus]
MLFGGSNCTNKTSNAVNANVLHNGRFLFHHSHNLSTRRTHILLFTHDTTNSCNFVQRFSSIHNIPSKVQHG